MSFLVNIAILYPLKTPENQRVFGVFRGYKMEIFARKLPHKENSPCRGTKPPGPQITIYLMIQYHYLVFQYDRPPKDLCAMIPAISSLSLG